MGCDFYRGAGLTIAATTIFSSLSLEIYCSPSRDESACRPGESTRESDVDFGVRAASPSAHMSIKRASGEKARRRPRFPAIRRRRVEQRAASSANRRLRDWRGAEPRRENTSQPASRHVSLERSNYLCSAHGDCAPVEFSAIRVNTSTQGSLLFSCVQLPTEAENDARARHSSRVAAIGAVQRSSVRSAAESDGSHFSAGSIHDRSQWT